MNGSVLQQRRVLAIGPVLAARAKEALPEVILEAAAPEREDALAALHPGLDLVLIDCACVGPELSCEIVEAVARRDGQPGVLLVDAQLSVALVRALMQLHRSDMLEAPFATSDLARAAAALLPDAGEPQTQPQNCRCWTLMGAVGGAGATTIAIELAATLAKRASGPRQVALIDLNLADGAAAAYLGAKPNMLLAEASSASERLDPAILGAFAAQLDWGFDLFAGPRDPQAFCRMSSASICRLLEVACQVYGAVIVDLPRLRQPWSLDVLAGSDEVMIVSELTVPALLSARALVGEIEQELKGDKKPRLILNRLAGRKFGPAPSRAEAEKALGRKIDGAVTSDWEAAACSINLGGPVSEHRPRSRIVKDVAALVDRLHARPAEIGDRVLRAAR